MTHRLARRAAAAATETADVPCYRLDEQIGFLLRRATQRHLAIFAAGMRTQANGGGGNSAELTPMQWATLAKLYETGASAQNSLGRATAMDAATVKGVVDRLKARGLVESRADPADGRRRSVVLTASGRRHVEQAILQAEAITEATLAPLTDGERETLLVLLKKLA